MDYRSQEDHRMGMPAVSLGYDNPPPNPTIRVSAFSKPSPLLPCSSSSPLLSPKEHGQVIRNGSSTHGLQEAEHHPAGATGSNYPKAIKYRECLRNHAAAIGGHVLDGCCEFMPDDVDPLKCAACDCHRSFHRKRTDSDSYYRRDRISVPLLLPPPHPPATHTNQNNYHKQFAFPPSPSGVVPGSSSAVVAFGGNNSGGSGATTESSSEERLDASLPPPIIVSKKRFRTKFTPQQKEKMLDFAERVGWRIQRQEEATVENFCKEVGVRRQVLKVWMHNNKHSMKKQQQQLQEQQQEQQQQMHPHLQQQQRSLGV